MRSTPSLSIAAVFILSAFAGCSSEDATLKAAFVVTPVDAGKSTFKFDASSATGKGLTYSWDYGDRSEPGSGEVTQHTYEFPNGEYDVTLTVTDAGGAKRTTTQGVPTGDGQNEAPLLYLKADKRRVTPSETVFFDGSRSVDADGDPIFFEWDFNSQLSDQDFSSMENLGNQQYGRFPSHKPAPPNDTAPAPTNESDNGGLTPSGHVLADEIAKAQARLEERTGPIFLHGPPPGQEPRNTNFDGRVNDTSVVQFFQFPMPAVYYVHVRVVDIKGDGEEGFLKILVEETTLPTSNTTRVSDQLEPAPLFQVPAGTDINTFHETPLQFPDPGISTMKLTYTVDAGTDELVGIFVCAVGNVQECEGSATRKLEPGPSGRDFTFKVGPEEQFPVTYKVFVVNKGNSVVTFDFPINTEYDTNPWFSLESGNSAGHH